MRLGPRPDRLCPAGGDYKAEMVHGTVRGHGGVVDIASTRGTGTTVHVDLQHVR